MRACWPVRGGRVPKAQRNRVRFWAAIRLHAGGLLTNFLYLGFGAGDALLIVDSCSVIWTQHGSTVHFPATLVYVCFIMTDWNLNYKSSLPCRDANVLRAQLDR
ncbi:hypothetical protein O6H91_06G053000 [Diphasiastrum complanatum]|uniref:Uncharacterized protein n=1 Tax=Diphasiastrum complanatum TaxID=34168 RepID=A0ACC2DE42_DIPCM|nr:hypothetical protein O6H91_06G053000 [Diphasiastrum complanatum]